MTTNSFREIFTRNPNNPLLTMKDIPYPANTVFNCGATMFNGETLLLLRVEDRRGHSHLTTACSKDGVSNWVVDSQATMVASPKTHPEETWGIEDPRVTYVEELEQWMIAYTSYSEGGPLVSLATTSDFKNFQRLGAILPPEDKDAALFPMKFGNRWAIIHRPVSAWSTGAHIWISFSPDLKHWGDHQILISARKGSWWDANKIGLSPPPLLTERGWLICYHGVRSTPAGCLYRLGLALLDQEDPRKVLCRSKEWIFSPEENYERLGDVNHVVFPCGWLLEGDEVRMYYGAADTCIALATAKLQDLLTWLDDNDSKE
ncbi:MAG: glycoside hydrolase family 130 protein [Planctomycetota bacterium]|jgi:predicted GH43/DUF377 family glycosyl hydrolase